MDVQPTPENGKGVGVENAAAGFEAQPKPDTGIKDVAKSLADKVRKLKGPKGGLRTDITGGIWDASIEMAAQTIEKDGTVAQAIANAIKRMRAMKPDATAEHEKAIEDHIRNAVGEPSPTEAAKAAPVEKKKEAPVAAKPEKAPAKTQASNYGIAARVTAARAAKGDIKPVESGEGTSGPEQVERGRELIKEGRSAQASLDAFRKDKKLSGDDMALVRAHGEDLAQAAKDAFDKYGMKSAEYKAAAKADSDWTAAIKPMQTEWHKIGEAQQGETEIDTGSFHGMRRAFTEATGRDFTPEQADKAEKISGQVKKAQDSADAARDKLLKAIKEQVPEEAAPKPDIGRLTKYFDDRAAEARQRLKDRSAGKIASANPLIADLGDRAIIGASYIVHGANKVADFARKWRDEFGDTTDRDMMAIWKASNEEHQKGVEGIVGAGVAAKTRAAKPTNPVWDAAKRYIDAGETSFDDVRHKVATDLGLPVAEVSRRLAEPKALRTVTNEMYQKMAARRNIISNAKNWLENQQAPGWLRAIKALPRAAFAAATFGHGSVGMVTHSAVNAFNPGAWSTYFPNFFKQFRMMGFHDKGAYHEAAIQNLIRDPNFTTARRAGLANDPSRITGDYEKAWTGPFFARVGLAGVRGFDTLKLFRQDRFNSIWENTPKSLQTPEMAKMVAIGINHATGIVGGQIHPGASTLFFAPKLEVSRWAFMIGDQAKASKTILNWKNETPEARQNALATVKQFATITGTYAGLLAINQGLLSAAGSDQKVNFTNPKQGDFLAFKAAGYRLGIVSPMTGMVRLFAELLHDSVGDRSTFEKLDSRADEIEKDTGTYIHQKFSPIAADVADVVSQADYAKRPLPFSSDKVPPYLAKQGVGKYTYPEWLTERAAPIPVSEAAREVWRKQGMNETDIHHWLNALTVASVMGSTGARLNGDTEPAKPPSYEPPTRKLFGTPH